MTNEIETEKDGVHWGWWVLWAILFWPILIIVAIIHTGRKNRAALREAIKEERK